MSRDAWDPSLDLLNQCVRIPAKTGNIGMKCTHSRLFDVSLKEVLTYFFMLFLFSKNPELNDHLVVKYRPGYAGVRYCPKVVHIGIYK